MRIGSLDSVLRPCKPASQPRLEGGGGVGLRVPASQKRRRAPACRVVLRRSSRRVRPPKTRRWPASPVCAISAGARRGQIAAGRRVDVERRAGPRSGEVHVTFLHPPSSVLPLPSSSVLHLHPPPSVFRVSAALTARRRRVRPWCRTLCAAWSTPQSAELELRTGELANRRTGEPANWRTRSTPQPSGCAGSLRRIDALRRIAACSIIYHTVQKLPQLSRRDANHVRIGQAKKIIKKPDITTIMMVTTTTTTPTTTTIITIIIIIITAIITTMLAGPPFF